MPFTAVVTDVMDVSGLNYNTVHDRSDYTDEPKNTFLDRYFYLVKPDGTYIQSPEGTDKWAFGYNEYPDDQRDVQVLTEDVAITLLLVTVPTTIITGSTYTASIACCFLDYAKYYKYNTFIAAMANNRNLVNIPNFYEGIMLFQALLNSSEAAITNVDPYASQQCILQLQYIMANPNLLN